MIRAFLVNVTAAQMRIALIVAVCAAQFYTSARDIIETALPLVRNDLSRAITFPICIDALILIAALTMATRVGVNAKARKWAAFGRYFGFGATIYANGLSGGIASADTIDAATVTGTLFLLIPAVALIATIELLIHGVQGTPASRKATEKNTKQDTKPERATAPRRLRSVPQSRLTG